MRSIKKRVYPSTNHNAESGGGAGNDPNESTPLHTISKNTQATIENASPTLSTATQNLNHEDTLQCSIDANNTNNPRITTSTTVVNQNGHIMDGADIDDDNSGLSHNYKILFHQSKNLYSIFFGYFFYVKLVKPNFISYNFQMTTTTKIQDILGNIPKGSVLKSGGCVFSP